MSPHRIPRSRFGGAHVAAVLTVAALLLPATAASAHSAIAPGAVEAGVPTEFTLTIPHGCTPGEPPPDPGEEVSPTSEISVRLPEGARDVTGTAAPGWNVETTVEDDRTVVTWSGSELPPDEAGQFPFTASLYGEEGESLALEVFQGCVEGAYRWIETARADDGEPLQQPAPVVELTSGATPPPETTAPTASDTDVAVGEATSSPDPAPTPTPTPDGNDTAPTPSASPNAEEADDGLTGTVAAAIVIAVGAAGVAAALRRRWR